MRAGGLLAVILFVAPCVSQSGTCLHYGRPYVSLEGRVSSVRSVTSAGGADNHWYIDTVAPVCVSRDPGFDDADVPTAQHIEFVAPGITDLSALEGQYVTLTGEFMHTYIPHYHGYPIFQVASIEKPRATAP
jgi:hypothetical protein